jgi:hypothetical protein
MGSIQILQCVRRAQTKNRDSCRILVEASLTRNNNMVFVKSAEVRTAVIKRTLTDHGAKHIERAVAAKEARLAWKTGVPIQARAGARKARGCNYKEGQCESEVNHERVCKLLCVLL